MDGLRNISPYPTGISLRTKTLVLIGATAALVLILLYALSQSILMDSFVHLEEREVEQDTQRVINTLEDNLAGLNAITISWARRDDTYQFVEDRNPTYIKANLSREMFRTLKIDLILFINSSDELAHGRIYDRDTDLAMPLTSAMTEAYLSSDSLLAHYGDYADADGYVDGLVVTTYGPLLLSIQPIASADGGGDERGILIVGRRLDEAQLKQVAKLTEAELALRYINDPALPADFKTAAESLQVQPGILKHVLDEHTFAGYALLNDISGQPILILRVQTPRDISHQGQQTVRFFLLAAAILALILLGVSAGLIERIVLARLLRLSQAVRQVSRTGNMSARMPITGHDELADLSRHVNEMLVALQGSQSALLSSETRYRALFENANDAIFLLREDVFIDCNPRTLAMFGCTHAQIISQSPYRDRFSPSVQPDGRHSHKKALEKIQQALAGTPQFFEWRHTRCDGTPFDAEVTLNRLELSGEILVQVMVHDITERLRTRSALRESEEQFSRLFDRIPINLYRTTPDGQLIMANPALMKLLGYTDLGALLSSSVLPLYVDLADRQRWQAGIEHEGMITGFQTRLFRADGTVIWVENTARAIHDDQGHVLYYEGALTDITERKQVEAERERLLQQAQVRATELATVAAISHQITTILDIEKLLWEVSRLIKEQFDLYHVHIYLFENDELRLVAGEGEVGRQLVAQNFRIPLSYEHSLVTRSARTHDVVIINDISHEPDYLGSPLLPNSRSELAIPMIVGEELIGVLNAEDDEIDRFTVEDVNIQTTLAAQVAIAIKNARLFAAERDQRIFAEALRDAATAVGSTLDFDDVLDHIMTNVVRVAPYDGADIMLIENGLARVVRSYPDIDDPDRRRWLATLRFEVDKTANLHQMISQNRPLVIADTHAYPGWVDMPETKWIRAHVGAPIRRDDQVIGFVSLDSATPGAFDESHAEQLQAFADQAALAIRNAQLFEQVESYAAELEQRVEERTHELEQQRAQLQAILDSMGEGVIYDEKFCVKYVNRALSQLTGYSAADFATQPYLEPLCRATYPPEKLSALLRTIYETVEQRGLWTKEIRLQRQDSSVFDAALTVTSVRNLAGQTIGAVTVIRDISQEKALQEQRARFIANASHELRTPLANIKTRLYLLQHQSEKADYHIKILNQVSDDMNELVENLLDVSRFERGVNLLHRREIVLQDLINRVIHVQQAEAERKKITLDTRLHPVPLSVYVDPPRMTQVITNLVSNAINYTREGGLITIELEPEPSSERAVMSIRDTGIGIAPDMLAHIFEPFFRAAERVAGGTGLGLTIARETIHLHGGEISVESEPGQGSVFTVKLDMLSEPNG